MSTTQSRCDALFEPLSAWVDGMADPTEARAVESHLTACAACREVEQALRSVTAAASTPKQEIPTGFAARTARLVRERAENTWDARMKRAFHRASEWMDGLVPAPRALGVTAPQPVRVASAPTSQAGGEPHPLSALLQTRALRAGLRPTALWLALAMLLFNLPTVALSLLRGPEAAQFFLVVTGLALLIALPWYHVRTDVSLLVSLRKGHCLDELIVSGLSASGITDVLARHSVTSLVRVGWPVALVLLVGAVFFPADPGALTLVAAALWLPAVCTVFVAGAYAVQAVVIYSRAGEGASLPSAAVALWLMVPCATVLYLGATTSTGATVAAAVLALLWVGSQGRFLAIWGLAHMPLLERWTRNEISRRRNRWIGARSQNPITIREIRRQASAVPAGLAGLLVVRLLPALVPAGALVTLAESASNVWVLAWWLGVTVLAWLTFLRAAAKTSAAVVQEREQGTLDALVQSGLTSREFVRGWLEVACWSLYLELGVAVTLGAILGIAVPEVLAEGIALSDWTHVYGALALAVAVIALMPWAGAWAGLGVSSMSRDRREAGGQTVLTTLRAVGAWLAVCGMLVTLAIVLTQVFALELDASRWSSLMAVVLPLGALGFVSVWCAYRGRQRVETHLASCWNEVPPVLERPVVPFTLQKTLVLWPFGVAAVIVSLQMGAVAAVTTLMTRGANGMGAGLLAVAVLVAAGSVATMAWSCRPLLDAVVERIGQNMALVSALAGVGGALAGALLGSVPAIAAVMMTLGLLPADMEGTHGPSTWGVIAAATGLGFVVCGGIAAVWQLARPTSANSLAPASTASLAHAATRPLALLAVLGGLYLTVGQWIIQATDVKIVNPALLERVRARVAEREEQRLRVPSSDDGFAPIAAAFMARNGDPVSARSRQIQDGFRSLSFLFVGNRSQRVKALQSQPDRAEREAAKLDAMLPLLRDVVARPAFLSAPRLSEGMAARVPNFILMRALSQSLSARALMHELAGRRDQALDLHILNLKWSDRQAGQGMLVQGMIVVAMKTIAEEGLLDFLGQNQGRLDARHYERIMQAEKERRMTIPVFQQHMENEMALGLDVFDRLARGDMQDSDLKVLEWVPSFWLARDRHVYTNAMLQQLTISANAPVRELARPFREDELITGAALVAAMLLPNARRATMQVRLSESRSEALRLICTLELMRLRDGVYPATLPSGFVDYMSETGTFAYHSDGKRYTLASDGVLVRHLLWKVKTVIQWMPRVEQP